MSSQKPSSFGAKTSDSRAWRNSSRPISMPTAMPWRPPMQISVIELPSPELEFGDDRSYYTDPRRGLASAGPFSLRFGRAHKSQIRIGIVGPQILINQACDWYKRCEQLVQTGKPQSQMYVDFPGFERAFQASLAFHAAWQISIDEDLGKAFDQPKLLRLERVLDGYLEEIVWLARHLGLAV